MNNSYYGNSERTVATKHLLLKIALGLLVAINVAEAQPFSEIVVFDASYSNPGFTRGLVWPEWLASQHGIPTPTQNGSAHWVGGFNELEPVVSRYLQRNLPDDASLIVMGMPFSQGVISEYWAHIGSQIRRLVDAGAHNFVVNRNTYGGYSRDFSHLRGLFVEANEFGDTFLAELAGELNVDIDRPSADGIAGFTSLMENPDQFGFVNLTDLAETGVANPHEYVWWDGGHMTTAAHRLLALDVAAALEERVTPAPVPLVGIGGAYTQDFDDVRRLNAPLPLGWVGVTEEVMYSSITGIFAPRIPAPGALMLAPSPDRALLVGVTDNTQQNEFLFHTEIEDSDLSRLRLLFDLEAWAMNPEIAAALGEAAFDVTIEADTGGGYLPVLDFGTVSTGVTLQNSESGELDGNESANRMAFDSGIQRVDLPQGSRLRVRWSATDHAQTEHVTFGIDGFQLHTLSFSGDVDVDGLLTAADIDRLGQAIRENATDLVFDVDQDRRIDGRDHTFWVKEVANTYVGDTDLNGEFNSVDIVNVLQAGTFATGQVAGWKEGDWNGDARFDRADIIAALQDGGYGQGPRDDIAAVPEPSGMLLFLVAIIAYSIALRTHRIGI